MDTCTKKFLTRQETADALSISLVTLARRLADGSIPFIKLGNRVLIPIQFIDELTAKAMQHEEA